MYISGCMQKSANFNAVKKALIKSQKILWNCVLKLIFVRLMTINYLVLFQWRMQIATVLLKQYIFVQLMLVGTSKY